MDGGILFHHSGLSIFIFFILLFFLSNFILLYPAHHHPGLARSGVAVPEFIVGWGAADSRIPDTFPLFFLFFFFPFFIFSPPSFYFSLSLLHLHLISCQKD